MSSGRNNCPPADTMRTVMERPDHTASGADDPVFTALWVAHRRRMLDLAFRMLLDFPDAEDVVQEAFTRLARTNIAALADPEGWLVIVTSRLCLDRLRARDVIDGHVTNHARARSGESGGTRRQRHHGHACPP